MPYSPILRPLGTLLLVLGLAVGRAMAEDALFDDSSSLLSGMRLRDAMFVLDPHKQDQRTLIRAEQARIEPSSELLQLSAMSLSARGESGAFTMKAAHASCHLGKSTIRTQGQCHIHSKDLSITGESFEGNASSLVFQTGSPIEVSSKPLHGTRLSEPSHSHKKSSSPWSFKSTAGTSNIRASDESFPLHLVQKFSGNLSTFVRCWARVKPTAWPETTRAPGPVAMTSLGGGSINLSRHNLEFSGPSAILAPNAVLITPCGLHLYRDTEEDGDVPRLTAAGGVTGWMKSPAKEYIVHAKNMDFAGDIPLLQFEGGPVIFQSGEIILQATEEWQFLRVMENGRIVISPGSWTTRSAQGG